MKTTIKSLFTAAVLMCSGSVMAQNLQSGYFMEGNTYRHELNPAFAGEYGYVAMPLLGNLNIQLHGNNNLSNFIYPGQNGKSVTFMHPSISVDEALGNLKDNNTIMNENRIQILGAGFKAFGGYNTIGISLRTFVGINMPKGMAEVMKDLQNKSYNVSDLNIRTNSFIEMALGHSRNIGENLRVGGKLKFLLGGAYANAQMDNLTLDFTGDKWTATAEATVDASVKGLEWKTSTKEYKVKAANGATRTYETVDDAKVNGGGLNGFGMAVDLGAEYDFKDLVPGLKASMSLLDLGFINWSNNMQLKNNGQPFEFDGFQNIKVKDGQGTEMSEQGDKLSDNLTDLVRLKDMGDQGSTTRGIGATMNIGVEYALPMYDKLRFGLLSTTRFYGPYTWNEERISANIAPVKAIEANVNFGFGTFGPSFGWMLNFHPKGFNFFVGMDHTMGKIAKQGIPLSSRADISMGINFTFGN